MNRIFDDDISKLKEIYLPYYGQELSISFHTDQLDKKSKEEWQVDQFAFKTKAIKNNFNNNLVKID